MKLAVFHNTAFDYDATFDHPPLSDGWVQVTGFAEVEFPSLSAEEQHIANELLALAKRRESFEIDFRRQRKAFEAEAKALAKTGT